MVTFYAYVYKDPRNGEPFYVGKGRGTRSEDHLSKSHNREMNFKIKKLLREGFQPLIEIHHQETEAMAFDFERELIKQYGRKDLGLGPLLNRTDGGDGVSGWKPDESTRLRWSEQRKANPNYRKPKSEEHREKLSQSLGGRKPSSETILKMVAARPSRKGKLHPMFGKHHSVETIQLCRESNLGRKWWNYNGESRFAFEPPGQEWKPGRASFVRRTKEEIGKVKCL